MSETDLNREPIELVEFVLPKCINTYGVAPCTASLGAGGGECYNCRATCQDVDNYRDTPDRHLTADLTLTNGEVIASGDLTRTADLFAGFEVRFGSNPSGIIWEQGGSAVGAYLGVTSGNLEFYVRSSDTLSITVDASQFIGKTIYLYTEIDFVASTSCTIRLWAFDPVELSLTLLGSDTGTPGTEWANTDDGAIGTLGGSATVPSRDATDWSGGISVARFYDSSAAPTDMSDNFNASLWIGRGQKGEPTDEVLIVPGLQDLGTIGTKINISASDDDYQPLGLRATLDFTCGDFAHSDIGQDPYLSTRLNNPIQVSTFWRKWLVRQKFGKVGALARVYDGYAGQKLSQYKRRAYVLDKSNYNEDSIAFHCRDVLSRTEFRKAQVPAPSTGILNADIDDSQLSFTVTGDVTADYPESGTVRINDEIIRYTSRSYADPVTTFTVDGTGRASDGSEATTHSIDDLVQICRRYTDASISDVLKELLFDDAQIEGQFVNVAEIEDEVAAYLDAYSLTTLITEPTGVDTLIGQMSEECSFLIWWDERQQQIRLLAIRAVSADDVVAEWTYEENILEGSMKVSEKPKQRLNIINFRYNPIDWSGDLGAAANFANGLKVVNGTTSLPEQYGNLIQSRDIFSRWLTTEAEANQTSSRLSLRYADIPQFSEFYVDAKDRGVWTGDVVTISHPLIVDANGNRVVRRWLVIEAEEVDPGHLIRYMCADITLDGTIYFITENSVTTYTPELFEAGNAFITDNNGLNADATLGATIS